MCLCSAEWFVFSAEWPFPNSYKDEFLLSKVSCFLQREIFAHQSMSSLPDWVLVQKSDYIRSYGLTGKSLFRRVDLSHMGGLLLSRMSIPKIWVFPQQSGAL